MNNIEWKINELNEKLFTLNYMWNIWMINGYIWMKLTSLHDKVKVLVNNNNFG